MNEEIYTFLDKINPLRENQPLRAGGTIIDNNVKYLSKFLPSLPPHKIYLLAVLLQHQTIQVFTKDELIAVSNLRLELLTDYSNASVTSIISNEDPLFDTGSYRINRVISSKGIPSSQVNYMNARKIKSISSFIQELL